MTDDDASTRAQRAKRGSPFLNTAQAGFYVGLSATTLEYMRRRRIGPVFRRHGNSIRYHIDDLDAWSRESGKGPEVEGRRASPSSRRKGGDDA
ncbi:MAG: DNA-binding protein [Novosphingobium sp.]